MYFKAKSQSKLSYKSSFNKQERGIFSLLSTLYFTKYIIKIFKKETLEVF